MYFPSVVPIVQKQPTKNTFEFPPVMYQVQTDTVILVVVQYLASRSGVVHDDVHTTISSGLD